MSPPSRETVTEISRATGISRQTLYCWRHLWKREGELVPASSSSAEEWDSSDKLAAVNKLLAKTHIAESHRPESHRAETHRAEPPSANKVVTPVN